MIIGHEKTFKYFNKLLSNNSISHAYSFNGIKGIGKYLLSREVVKSYLCKNDDDYVKLYNNTHPDLLVISSNDSKIGISEVKKLEDFIELKPKISDNKAIIIDDADCMSEIFQNKILKFIESPPDNYLIILIVENQSKIIDTIRSRVIYISFNPLNDNEISKILNQKEILVDEKILALSNGSVGNYIWWLDNIEISEDVELLFAQLNNLLDDRYSDYGVILSIFKKWSGHKSYLLDLIVLWCKDLFYIKKDKFDSIRVINNFKNMEMHIKLAKKIDGTKIARLLIKIEELKNSINNFQNEDLVIDYAFMSI